MKKQIFHDMKFDIRGHRKKLFLSCEKVLLCKKSFDLMTTLTYVLIEIFVLVFFSGFLSIFIQPLTEDTWMLVGVASVLRIEGSLTSPHFSTSLSPSSVLPLKENIQLFDRMNLGIIRILPVIFFV